MQSFQQEEYIGFERLKKQQHKANTSTSPKIEHCHTGPERTNVRQRLELELKNGLPLYLSTSRTAPVYSQRDKTRNAAPLLRPEQKRNSKANGNLINQRAGASRRFTRIEGASPSPPEKENGIVLKTKNSPKVSPRAPHSLNNPIHREHAHVIVEAESHAAGALDSTAPHGDGHQGPPGRSIHRI